MFEGKLEDLSLPGLLQLLAGESSKSFRLKIRKDGQIGDLLICEGELLVATYGLLEGLDALSEFLNWSEGDFAIERVPTKYKSTARANINLRLDQPGSFTDQCNFLQESKVGLNTEIVPSTMFGTQEWQEALHVQPLKKEDYAVLGWITDGRTMRQAMREFKFDLITSIGILYRLLITRSVEIVRQTFTPDESESDDLQRLAEGELAKYNPSPVSGKVGYEALDPASGQTRPIKATTGDTMREPALVGTAESSESASQTETAVEVSAKSDKSKGKDSKPKKKDLAEEVMSEVEDASTSKTAPKSKSPRETQDLPAMDPVVANDSKDESMMKAEPLPSKSITFQVEASNAVPSPSAGGFNERRTDPLPLVSIDIERLFTSTFSLTKIGSLALANPDLDSLLKKVLLDVEKDMSLQVVLTDSSAAEGTVLETYRYCIERGYIEHNDPVVGLTVDLLLGKIELEQYLLQRRRITGDQLRDLKQIAGKQNIPVERLLVVTGYILPDDMERLLKEQGRFSR